VQFPERFGQGVAVDLLGVDLESLEQALRIT